MKNKKISPPPRTATKRENGPLKTITRKESAPPKTSIENSNEKTSKRKRESSPKSKISENEELYRKLLKEFNTQNGKISPFKKNKLESILGMAKENDKFLFLINWKNTSPSFVSFEQASDHIPQHVIKYLFSLIE